MDPILVENLIKLGMAVLLGGIIGVEREFHDKAAGFRTIILITVGSTLFTIFSMSMDPGFTQTRIAANIVTGIGFLGGSDHPWRRAHRRDDDCCDDLALSRARHGH